MLVLQDPHELIEEPAGVEGTWGGLWVELDGEEGKGFVFDALDGVVVDVFEPDGPVFFWKGLWVDGEAVILGGDVAALRLHIHTWLIL